MVENKTAEGNSNDWRQLCAIAAKEQDAAKLTSLVKQIIQALDELSPRFTRREPTDQCPEF